MLNFEYLECHEQYVSVDCGCPEESFIYGMAEVIMHLDPDGSGTAFVDFGEWDFEIEFKCLSMDELRKEVVRRIDNLPYCD